MLSQIDIEALIGQLQEHALADAPGTMTAEQVDAAISLLDRVLSDLHHIELCAADGQTILLTVTETASDDAVITKVAIDLVNDGGTRSSTW